HTRSYGDWSSDVCSSDLPQVEAELEVRLHDQVGIGLGGRAHGAEMDDDLRVGKLLQPAEQLARPDQPGDLVLRQVAPLVAAAEQIGRASCRERGWVRGRW